MFRAFRPIMRRFRPRIEQLENRLVLYAQPVHVWIAEQGYDFFSRQFGETALTTYLGDFIDGDFNEDEQGRTPFSGEGSVADHPSYKHFWAHDGSYARAFDDGLAGYDSAPNRAIQYITGGIQYDGDPNPDWLTASGAAGFYSANQRRIAFDYLGHAVHLLQDLSLPAHAHADPHLDVPGGPYVDPDPYHDWVDGLVFSPRIGDTGNILRLSFFTDPARNRWLDYAIPITADSSVIRSAYDIYPAFVPGVGGVGVTGVDVEPLYQMLLSTAGLADDHDTIDYVGQVDGGSVRGSPSELFAAPYSRFSGNELDAMAKQLVPRSILDTAELIRYFYGVVDQEGPTVKLVDLDELVNFGHHDPNNPEIITNLSFNLEAAATDQDTGDSGVGKSKFKIEYREMAPGGAWGPWQVWTGQNAEGFHFEDGFFISPDFAGKHGALLSNRFQGQQGYTYGFRVTVEDGAGNMQTSEESYVRIREAGTITFDFENVLSGGSLVILSLTQSGLNVTITRQGQTFIMANSGFAQFGRNSLIPLVSSVAGAFIANFSAPVFSVSIDMGDFVPSDDDDLLLEAFSGLNGTGSLLATAMDFLPGTGSGFTFRRLTLTSAAPISSIRFNGGSALGPNSVFYDNLTVEIGEAGPRVGITRKTNSTIDPFSFPPRTTAPIRGPGPDHAEVRQYWRRSGLRNGADTGSFVAYAEGQYPAAGDTGVIPFYTRRGQVRHKLSAAGVSVSSRPARIRLLENKGIPQKRPWRLTFDEATRPV